MSWFTRVLSCALAAVAMLFAALVLTSSDVGCYDRGPWGRTTTYRAVAEEAERMERIERQRVETDRALRARDEVLTAVIEGRCSLQEAAGHFWELNRSMSAFQWPSFRRAYPGATDAERCCRHVIRHVALRLEEEPARRDAVVRRLEAELAECLRCGPLRLPGVEEPAAP
jgi:hypothetical protein